MTIEVIPDDDPDVKIIKLAGPLTVQNFAEFQEMTRREPRPRILIVDLTEVPYLDSAALGAFVGIHVSCEATNRKYALVGANGKLKSLFELSSVSAFLVIYDTMAEARANLI